MNRDRAEIVADILSVAREGACKTRIMYRCNLSFAMVNRYLALLERKGLLTCNPHYKTTVKGLRFLRVQRTLSLIWETA